MLKLNEVTEMLKNESCIVGGAVIRVTFREARADDGDFFTYAMTVSVQHKIFSFATFATKSSLRNLILSQR